MLMWEGAIVCSESCQRSLGCCTRVLKMELERCVHQICLWVLFSWLFREDTVPERFLKGQN